MKKIITLMALHFALLTFAQPGTLDTSFNSIDKGYDYRGSLSPISKILVRPDGKIITNGIMRLSADGSMEDKSFTIPNTSVLSLYSYDVSPYDVARYHDVLLQPDGKVLICAKFQQGQSMYANTIVRVNADGSLDNSFYTGIGSNDVISKMSLQADGKIIICGNFTNYNNTIVYKMARLNSDGSLDFSFKTEIESNDKVFTTVVQPDGKIIIGCNYSYLSYVDNVLVTNIAKVARLNSDGSLDASFKTDAISDFDVNTILVDSNGKIMVGGPSGYPVKGKIARLNADGSLDTSFNSGVSADNIINTISIQSDGKVIIAGDFTTYAGVAQNRIARINTDGSLDQSLYADSSGANGFIRTTVIQPDGKILLGGDFTQYSGMVRQYLARLNTDGSIDKSFASLTGANDEVAVSTIQSDGKIIIGGTFSDYNDAPVKSIARLNNDGSLDGSFYVGTGVTGSVANNKYPGVYVLAIQPDNKIIVGGIFNVYNGKTQPGIVRLNSDGNLDTGFNALLASGSYVNAIAIQSDGKILVVGNFMNYSGTARGKIIRLESNGNLDLNFKPDTSIASYNAAVTLSLQPDGKILIITDAAISRLNADGSLDTGFITGYANWGSAPVSASVGSLLIQPDGKILVGGQFVFYKTVSCEGIFRLNADGSLDTGFKSGTAHILADFMLLQPSGKIIIGGNAGTALSKFARLNADGSLDTSFNTGTGIDGFYSSMSLQSDGKILIGGTFTSYNDIGRNRIARISGNSSLGLNENKFANTIQLYPNPVSDILTINTQEEIDPKIEIYDILGKSVKALTSFDKRVDVSSLPSGVYIINVTDGNNGVYKSKFIKK